VRRDSNIRTSPATVLQFGVPGDRSNLGELLPPFAIPLLPQADEVWRGRGLEDAGGKQSGDTAFVVGRAATWHVGRVEEKAGAVRAQVSQHAKATRAGDRVTRAGGASGLGKRIGDRENLQENYDSNKYRGSQHCTSTATPSLCVPSAQVAGKTQMKDAIMFVSSLRIY